MRTPEIALYVLYRFVSTFIVWPLTLYAHSSRVTFDLYNTLDTNNKINESQYNTIIARRFYMKRVKKKNNNNIQFSFKIAKLTLQPCDCSYNNLY